MDDVEMKVRAIVAAQMGVEADELCDDTRLVDDLGVDSLDTVELAVAFEGEFHLRISDDDAERMYTLRQTVDYLKAHSPR